MDAPKFRMLSKPEVAALLGCGERALERLIENRRFPPGRRYGRCIVWFESTVEAFLMVEQQAQRARLLDGPGPCEGDGSSSPDMPHVSGHVRP